MGTRRFATAENKLYLFSHCFGRFQCIHIWVPILLLAENVSSSTGSHIHFENFCLERGWDVSWKKWQLAPFLQSLLFFWDAVMLSKMLLVKFFFLTDILLSLYQFVLKVQFLKAWINFEDNLAICCWSVEQFYLFLPAQGCWSTWSVVVAIFLKEIRIRAVSAVDFGLLTVWDMMETTSENYMWFKYKNTTANP